MRSAHIRFTAFLTITALSACSGGGTPSSPIPQRIPIVTSTAPASASSQTRATFVVHWPSAAQAAARVKRRQTISASTQSISVGVNGGPQTYVNKPTLTGSPSTTSLSIPAPAGNDSFTFTAWDEVNGTGNVLDQASTSQDIIANANNTVSVTLDGVCAALVPTLAQTGVYIEYQNTTVPLASGSRTVLKAARLVGPSSKTFQFTKVDADGNTILSAAGTSPITVSESGTTPHVTITPVSTSATNNQFNIAALVAEPDGFSTSITATSPNCGTGTPTFPNSFQVSTSAEVVVADYYVGVLAYDQDGMKLATISSQTGVTGLAYNSKSNYFVTIESDPESGVDFQTLTLTGSSIGSSSFVPKNTGADTTASQEYPENIVYDAANTVFYFALGAYSTTATNEDGAIEAYNISGSTATYVTAQTYGATSPNLITALPNGNVLVNDFTTDKIYEFQDTLSAASEVNAAATGSAIALAFDSTRGNIIDINSIDNSTAQSNYGTFFDAALDDAGTNFSLPQPIVATASAQNSASVYSPGNDELYIFNINPFTESSVEAVGLSGAAIYQGGSTTSNLPAGAFPGLEAPSQALAIP